MNISELALKRPVLATVMNITIVLFGVVGFTFLAVREYPVIDPPIINVSTSYIGANSDVIESQITEPLENPSMGYRGSEVSVHRAPSDRAILPWNSIWAWLWKQLPMMCVIK